MTPRLLRRLEEQGLKDVYVSSEELVGRYVAVDLIDEQTGLVHAEAGDELTPELLARRLPLAEIPLIDIDPLLNGDFEQRRRVALAQTLDVDDGRLLAHRTPAYHGSRDPITRRATPRPGDRVRVTG